MKKSNSISPSKKIVVIYHHNCDDGFTAALAAWLKFKDKADYIPADYQNDLPQGLVDKEIYLVDFSYSPKVVRKLIKQNKKVVIIDHHITAKESASLASEKLFNLKHSGAVLAWQYFFPKKSVPLLFKYIEDQDLWNFKLPDARSLTAYLKIQDFTFPNWKKLMVNFAKPTKRKEYKTQGELIIKYQHYLINWLINNKIDFVNFEGIKTSIINFSFKPVVSELGHFMYQKYPPLAIIWNETHGVKKISLRSNGQVDVSKLAKKYGGGGHPSSAGFALPANKPLPWKKLKK